MRNRYDFRDLDFVEIRWELTEDGVAIQSGQVTPGPVPAGKATDIRVDLKKVTPKPGREYYVKLTSVLRTDGNWAAKGFPVA